MAGSLCFLVAVLKLILPSVAQRCFKNKAIFLLSKLKTLEGIFLSYERTLSISKSLNQSVIG
jgi:hypothetical protein